MSYSDIWPVIVLPVLLAACMQGKVSTLSTPSYGQDNPTFEGVAQLKVSRYG